MRLARKTKAFFFTAGLGTSLFEAWSWVADDRPSSGAFAVIATEFLVAAFFWSCEWNRGEA